MLSQSHFLSLDPRSRAFLSTNYKTCCSSLLSSSPSSTLALTKSRRILSMTTTKSTLSDGIGAVSSVEHNSSELDRFANVANKLADAAGDVIRKYFRKKFDIIDKEDFSKFLLLHYISKLFYIMLPFSLLFICLHSSKTQFTTNILEKNRRTWINFRAESPVTIADRAAEEAMISIIRENLPSHAIYGEENGWQCTEKSADYVWVLDPIDGTKSFITGKPLFGTLIALLHRGKPILGVIDQPILRERWVGITGRTTRLNGEEISTRNCPKLSQAYLYTTSPHLFSGEAAVAFARVRDKVKVPLYGCDCYAYALLASGHVDLVVESGLKPYDFLSLIPVIEGAGGVITDWKGNELSWEASSTSQPTSFNVVAAGNRQLHKQVVDCLEWP